MPTYSREEVEAAFEKTRKAQDANDWNAYADCFHEDGVYVEHAFGTFRGREKIRAWLVPIMEPCQDWTFPTEWCVIDGNRIVFKWWNRLPGRRADGSRYEFAGVSILIYGGDGKFASQEDIYNFDETRTVMREWRKDHAGG
ncbi:MAG: nuclear transport factor 2 family protein [Deltaproteobacteria bacterium]|nr:MAG: nuclear transport factor 2 family protein [Deltaproteobacteria bacterium]